MAVWNPSWDDNEGSFDNEPLAEEGDEQWYSQMVD